MLNGSLGAVIPIAIAISNEKSTDTASDEIKTDTLKCLVGMGIGFDITM